MPIYIRSLKYNGWLFLGLVALFLLFLPKYSFSKSNYIIDRAYLVDKTNSFTIADINKQLFTGYQSQLINKGYIGYPLWIRLRVSLPITQQLAIRILPTYLDNIEVYQHINHQWLVNKVGDRHNYEAFDYPVTAFAIKVDPRLNQSDIYIKLTTTSTSLISTEIINEKELLESESARDLILSAYLAMILMTSIWSLFMLYRFREKTIFFFVLMILVEFLFVLFIEGLGGHYLLPGSALINDKVTSLSVLFSVLFGLLFHREFIQQEIKNKLFVQGITLFIIWDCILIILYILGYQQLALKYNVLIAIIVGILLVAVPIDYFLRKEKTYTLSVAVIYFIVGPALTFCLMPFYGLRNASIWSLYANLGNGFLSTILLLKLVYDRNLSIESKLNRLSLEHEKEKWAHNQQKQLMSILVHEIKTPLSVLKLAVDRHLKHSEVEGYANRAINNIDELINRIVECDKLDSDSITLHFTRININQLIVELIAATNKFDRFVFTQESAIVISSDLSLLKLIFNNLLENALKYSQVDSPIKVSSRVRDQRYYFSVTNDVGIAGIPDVDFVFKKYYRNTKASRVPGTGLGLYLVNSLVNLLNGEIEFSHKNNKVVFDVWIPI